MAFTTIAFFILYMKHDSANLEIVQEQFKDNSKFVMFKQNEFGYVFFCEKRMLISSLKVLFCCSKILLVFLTLPLFKHKVTKRIADD